MSILSLYNPQAEPIRKQTETKPASFAEVTAAAVVANQVNYVSDARRRALSAAKVDEEAQFFTEYGKTFDAALPEILPDVVNTQAFRRRAARTGIPDSIKDQAVMKLRQEQPERFGFLRTSQEILEDSRLFAVEANKLLAQRVESAGSWAGVGGSLAGGALAAATDPINAIGFFAGAGAGSTVLRAVMTEFAIGAGLELVQQPVIMQWQKETGQEYGLDDAILSTIMGGAFPAAVIGVGRGARPAASYVFRKAADLKIMPAKAKDSLKYLAEVARVKESAPLFRDQIQMRKRSNDALDMVETTARRGERFNVEKLPVSEADMYVGRVRRTPLMDSTADAVEQLREPTPGVVQTVTPPSYKIQELPEQVLNKALRERDVRVADFEDPEIEMLESAGVKPNKSGVYDKRQFQAEIERRKQAGEYQGIPAGDVSHIERHLQNTRISRQFTDEYPDMPEETASELGGVIRSAGGLPPGRTADDIAAEAKELASDSMARANEAEFERLLEFDADEVIEYEGRMLSIRDIQEELQAEERLLEAIRSCGVAR